MQKFSTSPLDPLNKATPQPVLVSPAFCLLLPDFPYIGALPASGAHSTTRAWAAFQPSLFVRPPGFTGIRCRGIQPWPDLACLGSSFLSLFSLSSFALFSSFFLCTRSIEAPGSLLWPLGMGEMGSQGPRGWLPSHWPSGRSLVPSRFVRWPPCELEWAPCVSVCMCVCLYVVCACMPVCCMQYVCAVCVCLYVVCMCVHPYMICMHACVWHMHACM